MLSVRGWLSGVMKITAKNSESYNRKCIFGQVLLIGVIAQLIDFAVGVEIFKEFYFLGCGIAVWGYFIGIFVKRFMGVEAYGSWFNDYNQRMLDIAVGSLGNIILFLFLQWLFMSFEPHSAFAWNEVING